MPPAFWSEMPYTKRSLLLVTALMASRMGPFCTSYRKAREYKREELVAAISAPISASRALDAACGEKQTLASMPASPRSFQDVEGVALKSATWVLFQYASKAAPKTATG